MLDALRVLVHHSPCLNGAALQSLATTIAATLRQPGQGVHTAAAELLAKILLQVWDSDVQQPSEKHCMINALDRFCHQDILDPLRYAMPTWLVYEKHVLQSHINVVHQ